MQTRNHPKTWKQTGAVDVMTELEEFLARNRISAATWEESGCVWEDLLAIRQDHRDQSKMLAQSATFFANLIQEIPGVHSVRWRIKDGDHLLEKIVRKRAAKEEKYLHINISNYFDTVTDLIGIRALHLFKDDCFEIDRNLRAVWEPIEVPVAYIRKGDPDELIQKYEKNGLEVKVHPAGYRSVHYVLPTQPANRRVLAEVQIRTIFEEGWSEIDHTIRYPNFSDNELVGYFLTIFNRLSGSADEMGSFVKDLAESIQGYQLQIKEASTERDESLKSMEKLVEQLAKLKQQDSDSKEAIAELQSQLGKMRKERTLGDIFGGPSLDLNRLAHPSIIEWTNMARMADSRKSLAEMALLGIRDDEMLASSNLARLGDTWQRKEPDTDK